MTDIELFFKIAESEIRRKHIQYLKKQKCLKCVSAAEPNSPGANSPGAGIGTDDFAPEQNKGKAKYVKRFNEGIDTALKVLQREYKDFVKRMETEKPRGSKF